MPLTTPYMSCAEPYFSSGGKVGCLCLHGVTATPDELRWLGASLAERSITIYIPRLPGHGTDPRDLARIRWRDWFACAADGYHLLRAQCDQVFVLGHSMGGLLAFLLAADARFTVAGVLGLAVPVRINHPLIRVADLLKFVRPYLYLPDRTPFPERLRAEQQRRGEPVRGRVRYDLWSTAMLAELNRLMHVTWEQLPQVQAPVMLLSSEMDETVSLSQRQMIVSRLGSRHIEQPTLKESYHILPQDIEREQVFAYAASFIERISNQK